MTTNGAFAYLNGSILPVHEAAISPFDVGLLRGYAVFDLLQTIGGRPFMLVEHLQRLRSSADLLGLRVPLSDDEIARVIDELPSATPTPKRPCVSCSPAATRPTECTSIRRHPRS